MIIELILQIIFMILSYMCFKPDDILDFNFPLANISKSINMYRLLLILSTNYIFINESFISMYHCIVEYYNSVIKSASEVDFSLIVSTV